MDDCIEHERYGHEKQNNRPVQVDWFGATKHKECESQKTSVLVVATLTSPTEVTNTHKCVKECWDDGKMRGVEKIVKVKIVY